MANIVLDRVEINTYVDSVGPEVGRPERPTECWCCDARCIWFDGWRIVYSVVLVDGTVRRFDNGVPLQRVVCAACKVSWTLRPWFLYPQRSFSLDVLEAATLAYLSVASATYTSVALIYSCSARSVWRWVSWVAGRATPSALVAEAERAASTGEGAALIPRAVPDDHGKAYSADRVVILLCALQTLSALAGWARAQPLPPSDSSPLRFYLAQRFLAFHEHHVLVGQKQSPPLPVAGLASRRVQLPP